MGPQHRLCWQFAILLISGALPTSVFAPAAPGIENPQALSHGDEVLEKAKQLPSEESRAPYKMVDILNCEGEAFSEEWSRFRKRAKALVGVGLPQDKRLATMAAQIVEAWSPHLATGSVMHARVLMRQEDAYALKGFCLYGYNVAHYVLYRHEYELEHLDAIRQSMGWQEWPLDFSEMTEWPALWRMVPLHMENAEKRGGTASWSRNLRAWGDDTRLIPRPSLVDVQKKLSTWLADVGAVVLRPIPQRWPPSHLCKQSVHDQILNTTPGVLRIAVLGHHAGSSLEPFTMMREAIQTAAQVEVQARFFGQRHPKPRLLCDEFGYCDRNPDLDVWFMRYENRWLGEFDWMARGWTQATVELAEAVGNDEFIRQADTFICGGPFWLCSMLRSVKPCPMLLYFAWAAVPMVPASVKPHVLAQLQSMGRAIMPPTVFVVANHVLAAQFALQASLHVPVLRPHGLYVNVSYAPVQLADRRHKVLVTRVGQWAQQSGIALLEITLKLVEEQPAYPFQIVFLSVQRRDYPDTTKALTYKHFAGYYACIFWPWDVMMLLFNELYSMTMPLLLPEPRWMYSLMQHALVHTEVNWWHLRSDTVRGELPRAAKRQFPLPFKPWVSSNASIVELAYWYELTDFVNFPHVTNFASVPQMLQLLLDLDTTTVREGMRRFNIATLKASRAFYLQAAMRLFVPEELQPKGC